MKKRLLSAFLSLCMMLTMVPAAFAADDQPDNTEVLIEQSEDSSTPPSNGEKTQPDEIQNNGINSESTAPTETEPSDTSEQEKEQKVAQIDNTTYATLQAAISAVTENTSTTITLLEDTTENVTIPVGKNIVIDGGNHTLYGGIECAATATTQVAAEDADTPTTSLTVKNLTMDGQGTTTFGIKSQNQTNSGQMDLKLTVENCTIQNYPGKALYLTNTKELNVKNCTFKNNATGATSVTGDFTIDLNLCAVQDAAITIEGCTFEGEYGNTAPIKVAQRGTNDGSNPDDIQCTTTADVQTLTIKNCTFPEGTWQVKLGTSKLTGNAAPNTGAFPVTLENNTKTDGSMIGVQLGYKYNNLNAMQNKNGLMIPSGATVSKTEEGDFPVAMVGNTSYDTLVAAITANSTGTIQILRHVEEDVTVPAGSNLTIEGVLSTFKLTGQITCTATDADQKATQLTVKNLTLDGNKIKGFAIQAQNQQVNNNLSELSLTLENCTVQNYKSKALYLTNAKELTVTGCTFKDNAIETMNQPNTKGDYTIDLNLVGVQDSVINIKDTKFDGCCGKKAVIKIAARGTSDGTGATDLSGPNASVQSLNIEGCTFEQDKVDDQVVPALNIGTNKKSDSATGDNITGAYEVTIKENLTDMLIKLPYLTNTTAQSVAVAAGATAHKDANGSFETVTAVVDAAKPDVSVSTEGMTDAESSLATSLKNALENENSAPSVTGDGLTQATNNAAAAIPAETMTEAAEALKKASIDTGSSTVMVVVQPYMEIQITDVAISGEGESQTQTLTVDITPKYNVIATTDSAVNSENGIVTESGPEGSPAKNSVIMESKKDLTISEPVTVEIPLPASFVGKNENLYVEHAKNGVTYIYEGSVTAPEETKKTSGETQSTEGVKILTFTNPHGFSTFTISAENRAEAKIGETSYLSLQDAVNAVADKGEITVLKNGLSATVSGSSKTFTLKNSDTSNSITVTLNGQTLTISANSSQSFTYTKPSSGGGGGGGSATTSYAVSVSSASNGSVSVSPKNASKGKTVTITVKPNAGYELDKLTVTDKDGKSIALTNKGDGKYTFTMPASKVTVAATFTQTSTEPEALPFTDVSSSAYYYDAVAWAVKNNVTEGTSATTFSPDVACTRAQMVTFLWREAGSPEPATVMNPFTDVSSSAYYYDAVLWAVEEGITSGTSATTFSPDVTCTRAQTVTFLWRQAGAPVVNYAMSFTDVDANAYYAEAVRWAVSEGVTVGTSATTFSPNVDCTRAQIVTLMYRAAQ